MGTLKRNDYPLVSIVMPVYNADQFLCQSIESILNQTYKNFEFLIFNDGSTDESLKVIRAYKDGRIKVYHSEENQGYVQHLNRGIEMANGEFIARMDADDISNKNRIHKQIGFLQSNPEVGILGTAIRKFGVDGYKGWAFFETEHEEIKCRLFFNSAFAHPSVMMRKEIFANFGPRYNSSYIPAEDYNLWVDLINQTKTANLPEPLVDYRISKNQISQRISDLKLRNAGRAREKMLRQMGVSPSASELEFHLKIMSGSWEPNYEFFSEAKEWLTFLVEVNQLRNFFTQDLFVRMISKMFFLQCLFNGYKFLDTYKIFKNSIFSHYYEPRYLDLLKLKLKTIIKPSLIL